MNDPTQLIHHHELERVLAACRCPTARDAISLLYVTGQRPQELRLCLIGDLIGTQLKTPNLKRKRGAGDNRSKRAQAGLNREDVVSYRWIPLAGNDLALAAWKRLAGDRPPHEPLVVSPRTPGRMPDRTWLTRRWHRAWLASGLRPLQEPPCLYSLRHTRATLLVEAGVKAVALCRLMGWDSVQMAQTYYEASPAILEEAMRSAYALGLGQTAARGTRSHTA